MSDNTRKLVLLVLLAVGTFGCFYLINKKSPSQADPSALPSPSREFDQWHKNWEKQR